MEARKSVKMKTNNKFNQIYTYNIQQFRDVYLNERWFYEKHFRARKHTVANETIRNENRT